ncbi:MAG: ABC transporter permease [Acidobacteriota bacterium]
MHSHLQDLTRPLALREYLLEIAERRHFLWSLPVAELSSRHFGTFLGTIWLGLNPLLLLLVYYLVFSVILDVGRGVENFATFLAIGIFIFHFSQRSVVSSSSVVRRNLGLMRTVYFPRALLVLAVVLETLLAHLPALGMVLVFAAVTGETPHWSWLLLVPLTLLQCLFNLGASFWSARLGESMPDLVHALPYLFRLLFYGSGVLYSVEAYVKDPFVLRCFDLNPFYGLVTLARSIIVVEPVSPVLLLALVSWTAFLLITGFTAFRRGEPNYGST